MKEHIKQIWGKTYAYTFYMRRIKGTNFHSFFAIFWLLGIVLGITSYEIDSHALNKAVLWTMTPAGALLVLFAFWGAVDHIRIGLWLKKLEKEWGQEYGMPYIRLEVEEVLKENDYDLCQNQKSFLSFLFKDRKTLLITFLVLSTVAVCNIVLHDDEPTKFFLMIWVGLFLAAIGYTYYEFKNLDKNDWI